MQDLMLIGAIVTVVGIVFLGLSAISFRMRAVLNKRAWNGPTLPLLLIGLPVFVIGVVIVILGYPR